METKPRFVISPQDALAALSEASQVISYQISPNTHGTGQIHTDSRRLEDGDIFIAYRGVASDGHQYIETAIEANAGLIVLESKDFIPKSPYILVKDGRAAWAILFAKACNNPEASLTCIGVTGTNGKTSTTWMASHLLTLMNVPTMQIGTTGAHFRDQTFATKHTTPDPDELYPLLKKATEIGVRAIAMEVSSHAICQSKLQPIAFDFAAFTSFSRDHLDFHTDMYAYWQAKWRLFTELTTTDAKRVFCRHIVPPQEFVAGNSEFTSSTVWDYGIHHVAQKGDTTAFWMSSDHHLDYEIIKTNFDGSQIKLHLAVGEQTTQIEGLVPFIGRHAIENFVAALLLANLTAGTFPEPGLWSQVPDIPGRLERIPSTATDPFVVVDYAHTPDALEKTLSVLRPLTTRKLICVFGCGGDRDKGKRPVMGKIGSQLADILYVTSDNPRSENPEDILSDIKRGVTLNTTTHFIVDRKKAISEAILRSSPGDIVCIAGKGHETYQIIGNDVIDFDDRLVAAQCLKDRQI